MCEFVISGDVIATDTQLGHLPITGMSNSRRAKKKKKELPVEWYRIFFLAVRQCSPFSTFAFES